MRDLDPQTTADFWDAYLRAAGTDRYQPDAGQPCFS